MCPMGGGPPRQVKMAGEGYSGVAAAPDMTAAPRIPRRPGGQRPPKTSKWRNMWAQFGDMALAAQAAPEGTVLRPEDVPQTLPGMADALEQTGGNVGEAVALQRRGTGLGAGLAAGAIPITLAAPLWAPATGAAGVATALGLGAGEAALSGAVQGGVEGVVGGYSPRETAQMAGTNALFAAPFGAAGGALAHMAKAGFKDIAIATAHGGMPLLDDVADAVGTVDQRAAAEVLSSNLSAGRTAVAAMANEARQHLAQVVAPVAPMSKRAIKQSDALNVLRGELRDLDPDIDTKSATAALELAEKSGRRVYRLASSVVRKRPIPTKPVREISQAAEDAFHNALPQGRGKHGFAAHYTAEEINVAKLAARKAARETRDALLAVKTGRLSAARDAAELVPLLSARHPTNWDETWRYAKSVYLKNILDISDALRRNRAFGSVGPVFADMLDMQASLTERYGGALISNFNNLAKPISSTLGRHAAAHKAAREQIGKFLAGEIPDLPTNLKPIAEGIKKIWTHIGDEAERRGLRLVDQDLTRVAVKYKHRFSIARLREFFEMADQRAITDSNQFRALLPTDMHPELQNAIIEVFKAGGEFEARTGAALVPFRRAVTHFPVRYNPQYLSRLFSKKGAEFEAYVKNFMGKYGGSRDEAIAYLDTNVRHGIDSPFEIRGGSLQWSRNDLLDPAARIYDINHVIPHYIDVSARRLAGAKTFGAQDELLKDLRQVLSNEVIGKGGLTDRATGDALDGPGSAEAIRMFDDIVNASQGKHAPYSLPESVAKAAASTMFLTLKTALLQETQLVNPVMTFGAIKTLKARLGYHFNPVIREFGDVVGAVLSDTRAEIVVNTIQGHAKLLNPVTEYAIRPMDAYTRRIASIASALHTQDMAKALMKGGRKGREAAIFFEEVLKFDVPELIANGGKLTTEQLRIAGLHGSNFTMHGGRFQNLPFNRLDPKGRLISVLQNFGSMQAKYFQRGPLRQLLVHKNAAPLLAGLATMGIYGLTTKDINEFITGREKETIPYIADLWMGGVVGSFARLSTFATNDRANGVEFLAGAPAGAVGRLWEGVPALAHGDFDKAYTKLTPQWLQQGIGMTQRTWEALNP